MTYRSLFIEEHASQAAAEDVYRRDREVVVLGSLDAYRWHHPVERFARENDLPADYIDNCWVRVALGASALARFLQQDDEPPAAAVAMLGKIKAEAWYVVSEEEF
jgi:thioesterase domain-containing protein